MLIVYFFGNIVKTNMFMYLILRGCCWFACL